MKKPPLIYQAKVKENRLISTEIYMTMEKVWIENIGKLHQYVVIDNNTIYTLKSKSENLDVISLELSKGILNDKFQGIPIRYINTIKFSEDSPKLNIVFNTDSEEEISFNDNSKRREIFDYLKTYTLRNKFEIKKPNFLIRTKKPLISLIVVIAIFLYVLNIILGMEQGNEYEVVNPRRPGLAGIVLILAEQGIIKNSLIFALIALISIVGIFKSNKKKAEVLTLTFK